MSTNPNKNDALNDADLAAVFAADSSSKQATGPSAELDSLILQNAQASHQERTAAAPETFQQKYAPVIATAAVILIGIGLTPLNTNTSNITTLNPDSPFSEESITQASATNRQINTNQIDTDALGAQTEALAKLSSPSAGSMDAVAEPGEDSDALVELVTSADAQVGADEITIAQAPTAQQPSIQSDATIARADLASNEIKELGNTPNTQTPKSEKPDVAKEAVTASSDNTEAVAETEIFATEAKSLPQVQQKLRNASTVRENTQNALNISNALAPKSIQPNIATPDALNSEATTVADVPEIKQQRPLMEEIAENKSASKRQNINLERDESQTTSALKKQRVRPENFRRSPLLWIIEIKHLYTDEAYELAREELRAFRQEHPNNTNERLLPETLQTLKFD